MLEAFQLSGDARGGRAHAGYLEARAKDRKAVLSDEALTELRWGWHLGEKSFSEKVLAAIAAGRVVKRKKGGSTGGEAARAHDEAEAKRLVAAALVALDMPRDAADLAGRGKWKDGKEIVAALVRKRTGMPNRLVAGRLHLGKGHEVRVTRAARHFTFQGGKRPGD